MSSFRLVIHSYINRFGETSTSNFFYLRDKADYLPQPLFSNYYIFATALFFLYQIVKVWNIKGLHHQFILSCKDYKIRFQASNQFLSGLFEILILDLLINKRAIWKLNELNIILFFRFSCSKPRKEGSSSTSRTRSGSPGTLLRPARDRLQWYQENTHRVPTHLNNRQAGSIYKYEL